MKHFLIFRHGETDWNAQGRFQGHTDIPLNEKGRAQARGLIDPLRAQGLEVILSSDLSRARETAEIVAQSLNIPVFQDPGLREAFLGHAQGMTFDEIEAQFGGELLGRWRSDLPTDADISYPDGETATQVMERVFAALDRFTQSPGREHYQRIGISCHGGVIRRMMQKIRPPGSAPVPIPNAVLYHLGFEPVARKWQIL